jgi:hypothetical protein
MRKLQIGQLFVAVCRQKIKNDKQNVEAVIRVDLHVHICNICVTEMCYDGLFIFHESIFFNSGIGPFLFLALVELWFSFSCSSMPDQSP